MKINIIIRINLPCVPLVKKIEFLLYSNVQLTVCRYISKQMTVFVCKNISKL